MASLVNMKCLQFIEPIPILPIYIDGLGLVDLYRNSLRLAFYVQQHCIEEPGKLFEKAINLRVVMPLDAVARAIALMTAKLSTAGVDADGAGIHMLPTCGRH